MTQSATFIMSKNLHVILNIMTFQRIKENTTFFNIVFYDQGHMHLESIKCSFIFQHEKLKGALL